jgi:hypothetical protein
MAALVCMALVFLVWVTWSWHTARRESDANANAAQQLCDQVNDLGQPCAAQPSNAVSGAAVVPIAPPAPLGGTGPTRGPGEPPPTDEHGVPQAYQPASDALIVSVTVDAGRLVLGYSDGARVDAGPVDEQTLAIVLRSAPSASPSPAPSPVSDSPSPSDAPSPSGEGTPKETHT